MTSLLGLKSQEQAFEFVFPGKHTFDRGAGRIESLVKEPLAPSLGGFPIARVFFDVWFHSRVENAFAISSAIKAGVEIEGRAFDFNFCFYRDVLEVFDPFR